MRIILNSKWKNSGAKIVFLEERRKKQEERYCVKRIENREEFYESPVKDEIMVANNINKEMKSVGMKYIELF